MVPVYNEERVLAPSIERLHAYLSDAVPVLVADHDRRQRVDRRHLARPRSGSPVTSRTSPPATSTARAAASRCGRRGPARDAAVVAYMDVDLSTDLDALLPLVAPLVSGHSDVAIGSRLAPGSSVARAPKRELISRTYNLILRAVFATRVRDAQCGFKAVRADVARRLLPAIEDDGWFFDTELLVLAEHNGLRIHEVPVDWIDDADSRVHIARTALDDLRGTARMARAFAAGRGHLELGADRASRARGRLRAPARALRDDRRGQHLRLARALPADPGRARRRSARTRSR